MGPSRRQDRRQHPRAEGQSCAWGSRLSARSGREEDADTGPISDPAGSRALEPGEGLIYPSPTREVHECKGVGNSQTVLRTPGDGLTGSQGEGELGKGSL